jgi:rhodanese-related sulfurtransferase
MIRPQGAKMKRLIFAGIFACVTLAGGAAALAQEHPSVVAGASETEAKKLYDDLGQGKKVLVLDVRSPKEFEQGHIPGAINIPAEELSKRIQALKLSPNTVIVTMCEHGGRSSRASLELRKLGFRTTSFCRLEEWKKAGYKVEKTRPKAQTTPGPHKFTCHHYCQSDKEVADLSEKCDCACNKPYRDCMGTT